MMMLTLFSEERMLTNETAGTSLPGISFLLFSARKDNW